MILRFFGFLRSIALTYSSVSAGAAAPQSSGAQLLHISLVSLPFHFQSLRNSASLLGDFFSFLFFSSFFLVLQLYYTSRSSFFAPWVNVVSLCYDCCDSCDLLSFFHLTDRPRYDEDDGSEDYDDEDEEDEEEEDEEEAAPRKLELYILDPTLSLKWRCLSCCLPLPC
jgi:hypothetical protein